MTIELVGFPHCLLDFYFYADYVNVHNVLFAHFYRHRLLHVHIICLDVRLSLYAPYLRSRHYCVFNMSRCPDACPVPCNHELVRMAGGASVSIKYT